MTQITGTLANYYKGGPVGILPGQSMFATDSSRQGLYDARSSFVRMLNIIFARNPIAIDRAQAVQALSVETPIDPFMVWRRPTGVQHIEAIPPNDEWNYEVYSLYERDRLLLDPQIGADILGGQTPRVLVNGIGNDDSPQWSVYIASLPDGVTEASELYAVAAQVYSLAPSYDFHVADFNSRDLLVQAVTPITIGQRVLVDGNTATSGFWTIWKYVGISDDAEVDAAGFLLVRYQTYRTSDFWSLADWYDTGYSSTEPPVVRYATSGARDIAENPNPKTTFVRVDDDGTGSWVWTAYLTGAWVVVARQNGTIQFSSQFYDNPSRPVIGFDPVSSSVLSQIPNRDGSWEFKVLFDLLQDVGTLEALEVNEIFFSMLHFIHAQQDQVAWAFKTSFLTVGGYNESLTQTPVTPVDNTQNLLDYLQEVTPYRVHTRDFTQIVTPQMDNAVVHVTDFDFPLYYDSLTAKYRNLDITNPADLAIVQTQQPWLDWYNTYTKAETRPANYLASIWNGVRHFNIKINFDRVDHMPVIASQQFTFNNAVSDPSSFTMDVDASINLQLEIVEVYINRRRLRDAEFVAATDTVSIFTSMTNGDLVEVDVRQALTTGLAADRIQQFYDPTNIEAQEKNLRTLMGLNFKGNVADGGNLADNSIRDYDIDGVVSGASTDEIINPDVHHFQFADPLLDQNRPEELIATGSGESFRILYANTVTNSVVSISSARPGTDLLAPQQVGDFDAAPLDSTLFDQGSAQDTNTVVVRSLLTDPTNIHSSIPITYSGQVFNPYAGQDRSIYVARHDAWEYTDFSAASATLAQDLIGNSNTIIITSLSGTMPFAPPVTEQVKVANAAVSNTITSPGVIWINDERIEFFNYANSGSTYSLTEIRRGTHNTRIGAEQIAFARHGTGFGTQPNGSITTFFIANVTSSTGLNVEVNEVLRGLDGTVITADGYTGYNINVPKQLTTDYTVATASGGLNVTFKTAPLANTTVYLTKSFGSKHPAGSKVFNGAWTFTPIIN